MSYPCIVRDERAHTVQLRDDLEVQQLNGRSRLLHVVEREHRRAVLVHAPVPVIQVLERWHAVCDHRDQAKPQIILGHAGYEAGQPNLCKYGFYKYSFKFN